MGVGRMRGVAPWGATRQSVGAFGEDLAARYLVAQGWEIVERNFRCPEGEIDLVAVDDGVIVVCEVKTRRGLGVGDPVEAVTPPKHLRLRRLARIWLEKHPERVGARVRIDVIGVILWPEGGEFHHIREVTL